MARKPSRSIELFGRHLRAPRDRAVLFGVGAGRGLVEDDVQLAVSQRVRDRGRVCRRWRRVCGHRGGESGELSYLRGYSHHRSGTARALPRIQRSLRLRGRRPLSAAANAQTARRAKRGRARPIRQSPTMLLMPARVTVRMLVRAAVMMVMKRAAADLALDGARTRDPCLRERGGDLGLVRALVVLDYVDEPLERTTRRCRHEMLRSRDRGRGEAVKRRERLLNQGPTLLERESLQLGNLRGTPLSPVTPCSACWRSCTSSWRSPDGIFDPWTSFRS